MNWKARAAVAAQAAPVSLPSEGVQLFRQLVELVRGGKVAPRDLAFANSLIQGFQKYGDFTPRQLPHVARLVAAGDAPAAAPSPDAPLAARLRAALSFVPAGSHGFAVSLLAGFDRYGGFTDRQRPYAEQLAALGDAPEAPEKPVELSKEEPVEVPPPPAPSFPKTAALFGEGRFARFDAEGIQLRAKNDFSVIWILQPGFRRPVGRLFPNGIAYVPAGSPAQAALRAIESDPMAAAKGAGLKTGRCSCCGRALTDPQSIEIGIGPICLAKMEGF